MVIGGYKIFYFNVCCLGWKKYLVFLFEGWIYLYIEKKSLFDEDWLMLFRYIFGFNVNFFFKGFSLFCNICVCVYLLIKMRWERYNDYD